MSCIDKLQKLGYIYQCTNLESLKQKMEKESITFYVGFDCTANSLHVGNLMQIMLVRTLQQYGHRPIILIGGATTKIGDPSGKDETRKYLDDATITQNALGIKKSLSKFIKFGSEKNDAILVNNADWLDDIRYLTFLRDFGKLISVNRMLTMDSVRLRLEREQHLTFLEFNYMLLQSYDFCHLNKNFNCELQLGGRDQWGNIVSSVDLVRRSNDKEVFGLTTPLLTTSSGAKMGKSANGAIWLNEDNLSPYEYFQFWRNVEDADVLRFAKLYCEFDEKEMNNLSNLVENQGINEAKKLLAYRTTELCHGKENATNAIDTAIKIFEEHRIDHNLPTIYIEKNVITSGVLCYELFVTANLAESHSAAKRLIKGMGARVNDIQVTDKDLKIDDSYLIDGVIKISSGKKKHALVKIKDKKLNI